MRRRAVSRTGGESSSFSPKTYFSVRQAINSVARHREVRSTTMASRDQVLPVVRRRAVHEAIVQRFDDPTVWQMSMVREDLVSVYKLYLVKQCVLRISSRESIQQFVACFLVSLCRCLYSSAVLLFPLLFNTITSLQTPWPNNE